MQASCSAEVVTSRGGGQVMIITPAFRRALREWLAVKGHTQRLLARAIGMSQANVSNLLNKPDDYKTSEWVRPICEFTGIPLPHPPDLFSDDDLAMLEQLKQLRAVDGEAYEYVVGLMAKLKTRPK